MTKHDKYMGKLRVNSKRKIDPNPERPTSVASSFKSKKRFGFTFEYKSWRSNQEWISRTSWAWYETAKQRDQGMTDWKKRYENGVLKDMYRNPQPVER
jgi:hypothetical protein